MQEGLSDGKQYFVEQSVPGVVRASSRTEGGGEPDHAPLRCVPSRGLPGLLTGPRYVLSMRWEVVRARRPQRSPTGRSSRCGQWGGSFPEPTISPAGIPERDLASKHPRAGLRRRGAGTWEHLP